MNIKRVTGILFLTAATINYTIAVIRFSHEMRDGGIYIALGAACTGLGMFYFIHNSID